MESCIEQLKEFVSDSQSFIGITFNGCYTMDTDNFLVMFSHYIETGENYLDEYSEMTWLSWGDNNCPALIDFEYFPEEKRKQIKKWLNGDSFWNLETFVSTERIKEIKENIILSEAHDINKKTYKHKRKQASAYIAKREVRKRIFEKHGKVCAECGSKKNIEIDHIIPVVKGGNNEDKNLRPLCKICNGSKGGR